MLSLRFDRFGEPEDVLVLQQVEPPALEAGCVQVRMRLRPVNPSDLYQIRGRYARLPQLPATPGLEGLGVVETLGSGVHDLALGQSVVFRHVQGTWAELLVVPREDLLPVPPGVPEWAAAQVMVNPLTAFVMVQELALRPGAWIVLTAPRSAVGHCVLDLSRRDGFHVLALARHAEDLAGLRAAGAAAALSTQDPGWFEEARGLVGGGAAAVLDAVGGPQASQLFLLLQPGGTYLVFGALSLQPLQFPGGQMIYKHATVRGFMIFHWKQSAGEDRLRTTLAQVFDAQASGLLCPPVEAVLPLAETLEAVRRAEAPGRRGKILLGV
jgi:NADPH:quinone reductase